MNQCAHLNILTRKLLLLSLASLRKSIDNRLKALFSLANRIKLRREIGHISVYGWVYLQHDKKQILTLILIFVECQQKRQPAAKCVSTS